PCKLWCELTSLRGALETSKVDCLSRIWTLAWGSTHSTKQEQDIAGYLTHSASESSNLARKFRRNCRALERYQSKWEERIGKTQDDRKKMEERYKTKKAENEKGLPWLKIPDLPKRVSRNADGV
ncbi:hypothetical protein FOZ63_020059, partial [Perkinsus olseni]